MKTILAVFLAVCSSVYGTVQDLGLPSESSFETPTPTASTTPIATPTPCSSYVTSVTTGVNIVPALNDAHNHCDDCTSLLILPFPFTLYDQTFATAQIGSNGYLSFGLFEIGTFTGCLPNAPSTYTIFPFAVDQLTTRIDGGVYTGVTGTAPNRVFNIWWRACQPDVFASCLNNSSTNYEVQLLEGTSTFRVIFGPMGSADAAVGAVGVQKNSTAFTQYSCNAGGTAGQQVTFTLVDCQIPTPTPIATPTPTPALVSISGTVPYCSNPVPGPVPNVTLTLTGSASATTLSDGSSAYQFTLPFGGTYTVTPTKSALLPTAAGINTTDVLAVQRYFLGITAIPPGCRLMAADVTGDGNVSTSDVIAIQRFFLGFTAGTANVGKYKFIPAIRTYPSVIGDQTFQNYDTLIFGDVASNFAE